MAVAPREPLSWEGGMLGPLPPPSERGSLLHPILSCLNGPSFYWAASWPVLPTWEAKRRLLRNEKWGSGCHLLFSCRLLPPTARPPRNSPRVESSRGLSRGRGRTQRMSGPARRFVRERTNGESGSRDESLAWGVMRGRLRPSWLRERRRFARSLLLHHATAAGVIFAADELGEEAAVCCSAHGGKLPRKPQRCPWPAASWPGSQAGQRADVGKCRACAGPAGRGSTLPPPR